MLYVTEPTPLINREDLSQFNLEFTLLVLLLNVCCKCVATSNTETNFEDPENPALNSSS